jgi:hypothetical protein
MHQRHNRTIRISKEKLIEKIKENKLNHVKEYDEAVLAYVIEANKQLKDAKKNLDKGNLQIQLQLTTPINRADEYDKVVNMFEWELDSEIELTQNEFNEYVHDENSSAQTAKYANSFYTSRSL